MNIEVLEKRYAEVKGARMLEAAKEAAKDEKNKVPIRAVISHFLYTGEVIPGYEDFFPRFEAQPRISAPTELRH